MFPAAWQLIMEVLEARAASAPAHVLARLDEELILTPAKITFFIVA